MEPTVLSSLLELKESIGALTEGAIRDKEAVMLTKNEIQRLHESVNALSSSIQELTERLKPIEQATADYSGTKASVLKALAIVGIGNIGLGAAGAALFNRVFGSGP